MKVTFELEVPNCDTRQLGNIMGNTFPSVIEAIRWGETEIEEEGKAYGKDVLLKVKVESN